MSEIWVSFLTNWTCILADLLRIMETIIRILCVNESTDESFEKYSGRKRNNFAQEIISFSLSVLAYVDDQSVNVDKTVLNQWQKFVNFVESIFERIVEIIIINSINIWSAAMAARCACQGIVLSRFDERSFMLIPLNLIIIG